MTAVVDLAAQQTRAAGFAFARGMHLFPVDHPSLPRCAGRHAPDRRCDGTRGKHPEPRSWRRESTNDPRRVERMFGTGLRNLGVDCGRSRLLVLDEDSPGELDRLCADLEVSLPATFTVSTGKGAHLYFLQPDNLPFGNGVGRLAGYRIDVRGRGGYVVGPGSVHQSGRRYEVADSAPIAPMPEWLADALHPRSHVRPPAQHSQHDGCLSNRMVSGVLRVVLDSHEGGRNNALHWSACRLYERVRDGRLGQDAAVAMLLEAAAAVGLPDGEARATVDSARRAVLCL